MSNVGLLVGVLLFGSAAIVHAQHGPHPAQAQNPGPPSAAVQVRFESWRPASPFDSSSTLPVGGLVTVSRERGDRVLLGGAIGAAAGIVFCTVMSTLTNDSAEGGLSFCPLDSYLYFAGGGFVLGALIGLMI